MEPIHSNHTIWKRRERSLLRKVHKVCLLSNFRLFEIKYMRYLMTFGVGALLILRFLVAMCLGASFTMVDEGNLLW